MLLQDVADGIDERRRRINEHLFHTGGEHVNITLMSSIFVLCCCGRKGYNIHKDRINLFRNVSFSTHIHSALHAVLTSASSALRQ